MRDWKNTSKTWGKLKGAGPARGNTQSTQGLAPAVRAPNSTSTEGLQWGLF